MSSLPVGAAILLVVGAVLALAGGLALVRLGDVYARLGAAGKCTGLGVAAMLVGAAVAAGGGAAVKAVLCLVLVLLSGAVVMHALARGAHRAGAGLPPGSAGDEYGQDRTRRGEL